MCSSFPFGTIIISPFCTEVKASFQINESSDVMSWCEAVCFRTVLRQTWTVVWDFVFKFWIQDDVFMIGVPIVRWEGGWRRKEWRCRKTSHWGDSRCGASKWNMPSGTFQPISLISVHLVTHKTLASSHVVIGKPTTPHIDYWAFRFWTCFEVAWRRYILNTFLSAIWLCTLALDLVTYYFQPSDRPWVASMR